MTRTPYDQTGKAILEEALSQAGTAHVQHEVTADAQWVDLWFEPDPGKPPLPGLLGRMAREAALFEPFHEPPSVDDVRGCVRKQLTLGHQRSALPRLWILSAGRPSLALDAFGLRPRDDWPAGVYCAPHGYQLFVAVAAELPATRDTLLLRLMGAGRTLAAALTEAKAIERDDWDCKAAAAALRVLRSRVWGPADEEIAMQVEETFRDWLSRERAEARAEGSADVLLRVLTRRFGELPPAVVSRVRAADLGEHERLTDRALVEPTLDDVFR